MFSFIFFAIHPSAYPLQITDVVDSPAHSSAKTKKRLYSFKDLLIFLLHIFQKMQLYRNIYPSRMFIMQFMESFSYAVIQPKTAGIMFPSMLQMYLNAFVCLYS